MLHRKNKNLKVVRDPEEQTDKLIEKIIAELNGTEVPEETEKGGSHIVRRVIIAAVSLIVAAVAIFLLIQLQTYTKVSISETYGNTEAADGSYEQFGNGILKYSRDGISYLNQRGEEQWNHPYQIKAPFVYVNEVSGAVADRGGNDICVFQKDGVKGEIHTTLPIQKLTVSEQGIVCAVLKNDMEPVVICYDSAGNELVEHRTSLAGTGYPVDMCISPDGEVMQGIYLYMQDGKITSKVIYYNFGEAGAESDSHQVASGEYEGTIMAAGFFLSQNVSAAVGDHLLTIYKGDDVPGEEMSVEIDKEIKSVFHSDRYIGMVLKNEGKGGYELRLYNTSGKKVMSEDFTGDYGNIKMCGDQVIMYDGRQCCVYLRSGVKKFQGEMDSNIMEIFPVFGVNKYIVINADGMQNIRFVK